MLNARRSIFLPTLLSVAIVVTGCQSLGMGGGSYQSSLAEGDDVKFFSDSGWGACGWGALGGALAGVGVSAATHTNKLAGAAIGAVAGCATGMTVNYYLDKNRKAYANKEDRLNAYINDTRKNSQMVAESTAKAKAQFSHNSQVLASLKQQLKAGTIKQEDAQKQLAQVDADIQAAQNNLAAMKKRSETLKEVAAKEKASGMKTRKFENEISNLNRQIAAYERLLATSTQQRSAIQAG